MQAMPKRTTTQSSVQIGANGAGLKNRTHTSGTLFAGQAFCSRFSLRGQQAKLKNSISNYISLPDPTHPRAEGVISVTPTNVPGVMQQAVQGSRPHRDSTSGHVRSAQPVSNPATAGRSQKPATSRAWLRHRQPGCVSQRRVACSADAHTTLAVAAERCRALTHVLPSGLHLELLHQQAAGGSAQLQPPPPLAHRQPALLFLHGAMHGAWCWQEHFMPFFAAHGVESYALSLRGHGRSDPVGADGCCLADQLSDIASVVSSLPGPPILVGHSIGGLIAQRGPPCLATPRVLPTPTLATEFIDLSGLSRGWPPSRLFSLRYLAEMTRSDDGGGVPAVAGAALLANSGPRQLMPGHEWFLAQRSPWHVARVFWWMLKRPVQNSGLVRDMFFSPDLPRSDFERYHAHLKTAAQVLPITADDMKQQLEQLKLGPHALPPIFVLGGADDGIVARFQLDDAADFFGTEAVVLQDVAHDLMLDTRWEKAADVLLEWVSSIRDTRREQ